MKIERMRKQTLLNVIAKCQLQIYAPQKLSVPVLRRLVSDLIPTYIEDHFIRRCRSHLLPRNPGLRVPGRNQCHLPGSGLEFDFSWRSRKVSIEIHGGLKNPSSGHRTEAGVKRDMRKANLAQLEGWLHLQLTTEEVMDNHLWSTHTLPMIEKALQHDSVKS